MDLLIIRHAPAEDREEFAETGQPDTERPLTERGISRMKAAGRGLTTLALPVERMVSSPLLRARQTADILTTALELKGYDIHDALAPGVGAQAVEKWLKREPEVECMALVGHEPDLGELVSQLLCGTAGAQIRFKKGGALMLRFDQQIEAGKGRLVWSLPPAVLRSLAD
ncbi:MAG: phosphohistidine phosphatase SixA, partial [Halothiobacillaceae bacterium]